MKPLHEELRALAERNTLADEWRGVLLDIAARAERERGPERIVDRCPSCGSRALFIGKGGWLTCSVIGCKEPRVSAAIDKMRGNPEREAFVEAADGYVEIMLELPGHPKLVPEADARWLKFKDTYLAKRAAEEKGGKIS